MAAPSWYSSRNQKERTRRALVAAARELLARGITPTVEQAAVEAAISRTTAYRYFPNQRRLVAAAHPEIEHRTLLPDDAPADPAERLDLVLAAHVRILLDWEPQLRASLRLSLEPGHAAPVLRRGRAIGWIADALAPLQHTRPEIDVQRLAVAVRSATGIEAFIWLVDVAGLSREDAAAQLRWNGRAVLRAALDGHPPPR